MMLEGHLYDGCQALGKGDLAYGVSITDGCLGWEASERLLQRCAMRLRQ